jgi:hypothetical protein
LVWLAWWVQFPPDEEEAVEEVTRGCGKLSRDDRTIVAFSCNHLAALTALLIRFPFVSIRMRKKQGGVPRVALPENKNAPERISLRRVFFSLNCSY